MILPSVPQAFGQELIFKNIGARLDLPSFECYNVVQDHFGYIWISTDNGLCRYNGRSSTIFNTKNGLPDNGIYFMEPDNKSGLRLISSGSTILNLSHSGFSNEKYSDRLRSLIPRDAQRAYLINETDAGDVINTYYGTYLADRNTGNLVSLSQRNSPYDLNIFFDGSQSYFIRNNDNSFPVLQNGKHVLRLQFVSGDRQLDYQLVFNQRIEIDRRIKIKHIDGTVFISIDNKMIAVDKNLSPKTYEFPSKILNLYGDPMNGLWVGLFQKGVYYYKDIRDMTAMHCLKDYSVSGTLMDREGGVWCSTLEKSVFYAHSINAVSYANIPKLDKLTTLLKTVEGKILVSTAHDNLFEIDGEVVPLSPASTQNQDFTDVVYFKNKWYLSNKTTTKVSVTRFAGKNVMIKNTDFAAYSFDTINQRLFASNYSDLFEVFDEKAVQLTNFDAPRIRTIAAIGDEFVYMGDNSGLTKVNIINGTRQKISGISSPVTKILKAASGKIWVASKGDGLHELRNDKLRRVSFAEKHDIFFDIVEDGAGTIWASSENGLVCIKSENGRETTRKFGIENGLLSGNIGMLAVVGKTLFVSTIDGLCSIETDRIVNVTPPVLRFHSMAVNNLPVDVNRKDFFLPYDRNSVSFSFDALTFKSENGDLLQYRLFGRDSLWKVSRVNEIHFENLPPASYRLQVYAVNNDGIRSLKPILISFTVEKPYWDQYWFLLLCVFAAALILFVIIRKIIARVRAKEMEKTRINALIAQSQLSALQAQMNPHFIFNAISSIQNYILKNNEAEAYNYLAKFGKLIRMVLNNSRDSTLPLFQELETLQLYVELEQLRFKNSFDFVLEVHEDVDIYNIHLPAMLIQPYIENGIWHGLMNLEHRKGILRLEISIENDFLKIVVEDNGVGREKSDEFKNNAVHHSVGMQLTEQRLQTIYKLKEYEGITIDVTDLEDSSHHPAGTRVVLLLPINI